MDKLPERLALLVLCPSFLLATGYALSLLTT